MEDREVEWFMGWEEREIWRCQGGGEKPGMNGLLATRVKGDVQAWAMTKGQVLVWDPGAAEGSLC